MQILKVSVRPQRDQPKETTKWYLIHYQGWNDRYIRDTTCVTTYKVGRMGGDK